MSVLGRRRLFFISFFKHLFLCRDQFIDAGTQCDYALSYGEVEHEMIQRIKSSPIYYPFRRTVA